ncbi:hypothetical protein PAXRUDRAFT_828413 [Paxillus rubicundulus Ve08.2h10]|uniref:Protein YOP1 n=1 Tax=Paxillus rubicundulus Ve08.2h10 TaxID=930991 RepID=A0A0D0E1B7_9AGAM|nr:hypothetical protein PAXRUDRAFT_828413 [Paxillus rubicundulus Ve08.2h10]
MLMSLVSHLLCSWFAFLLPCYSTYKALSHAPSPDELETLSMYWAVIGAFIAVEQSVGPFISWLPFYWEVRTLFLLYISLPQTQGSTYIYKGYFEPFCSKNEADLDAGIAAAQSNIIAFCRARISSLIDILWSLLNKVPITEQSFAVGEGERSGAPGVGVSLDQLKNVWSAYRPTVLAAFAPVAAQKEKEAGYVSGARVSSNDTQESKFTKLPLEEVSAESEAT